ncbi:MAG: glycosyl hydrolase [Candidatus Sumerlaeota bacterium]|nr:glycosyl hydrolase [Candidatus Sumerlaeota bacterium]
MKQTWRNISAMGISSIAWGLILTAILASAARAGDLEWSDPYKLPAPDNPSPAGYPNRDANLDAAPGFLNPPPGYGEVAFYWWLGDPLTKERIQWQLEQLKDHSVTALQVNYCHTDRGGRTYGLTFPSEPPLFSEAWWDLYSWFLKEAKKNGMAVSLSDYTLGTAGQGWFIDEILSENPSIGGAVLDKMIKPCAGGKEFVCALPGDMLSVTAWRLKDGAIVAGSQVDLSGRVSAGEFRWPAPDGQWQVVAVFKKTVPLSMDPMNPLSGKKVVEKFFQRFEDRNPGEGGKGLNFFFSDELQFGVRGNLWNDIFAAEFKKRKNYDIIPELAALFADIGPRTAKIRLDYSDVLVSLEEENYFRPVFDWHYKRGMVYGCDHGGRGRDVTEFGDYFRTQRWMTGPGADQPHLSADIIKNKVASSITHLYRRPRTWLEGYYGSGWGTTSEQVINATFRNFVMGQNLLTFHGLYYTTHGGWWEWAPPCNHFRMPYWKLMGDFMRYSERLSYLMSQGVHRCDVAIVYPVAPVEAQMGGKEAVEAAFGVARQIFPNGIDLDFMDFESLARARIKDKELQVAGEAYRVLVLPAMKALRFSTLQKALEFYRGGGGVIAIGALPQASERAGSNDAELDAMVKEIFGSTAREAGAAAANKVQRNGAGGWSGWAQTPQQVEEMIRDAFIVDFEFFPASAADDPKSKKTAGPQILHRKVGPRDVYMILGAPKDSVCSFRASGKVELWDPWTGKTKPLYHFARTKEGTRVWMPLEAIEPQLIVFSPGESALSIAGTTLDEILSVQEKDGKLTAQGLCDSGGRKLANFIRDGKAITLSGSAPEPLPALALDGTWEFEMKPCLDNRWGDYRWPPAPTLIGPEARQLLFAQETSTNPGWQSPETDDSKWMRMTYSYGLYFWKLGPLPDGANTREFEEKIAALKQVNSKEAVEIAGKKFSWQPYQFSWCEGVEGDPGHQGYHGLKEEVSDEFIALGARRFSGTGSSYEKEKEGSIYYLWTSVQSLKEQQARALVGGLRPASVWLGGKAMSNIGKAVTLPAGATPLLLRYNSAGRGFFVMTTKGATSEAGEAGAANASSPASSASAETSEGNAFSSAATFIWYPNDSKGVTDRFFRKVFETPVLPSRARLRITCDNAYAAFLNGKQVGQGRQWEKVQEYDVTKILSAGKNIIAVRGHNDGADAGLVAELRLIRDGKEERIVTSAAWRCAAKEDKGWMEAGYDDSRWQAAQEIAKFADSLWAKHQMGPPRLETAVAGATGAGANAAAGSASGDESAATSKTKGTLAMRWYGDPDILNFDALPQIAQPAGWYRFTAPPGLRGFTLAARGKVKAWIAGKEIAVAGGQRLADGAVEYKANVSAPSLAPAKVALRIEPQRGCYGGSALAAPVALDCGPGQITAGDWAQIDGLASYSGAAWYRKTVSLSPAQAQRRVILNLGAVTAAAEILVNGQRAGVKLAPPWTLDITPFIKPGDNRIEILVYNTLANHYSTIPTRYRGSPVSGLLGPVALEFRSVVTLE